MEFFQLLPDQRDSVLALNPNRFYNHSLLFPSFHDYIFGNKEQQKLFIRLSSREELLEERRRPTGASYTGPAIIHV